MKSKITNRAFLSAPLRRAAMEAGLSSEMIADKMGVSPRFVHSVIQGERDTSVDYFQEIASVLGMELSLVPMHLARSAVVEAGTNGEPSVSREDLDDWSTNLMLKLREHRLRNEATLEQVCEILGNRTRNFVKFQEADQSSSLPPLQVVQRYAEAFNLVLVAVGKNSEFANHAKAEFAREVTFKPKNTVRGADWKRESVDHILGDLLARINAAPNEFATRFQKLNAATSKLGELEAIEIERPEQVRMPAKFAAAVRQKMLGATLKGQGRIPYAEVIKPWGDPKSWAKYTSKQTFENFYAAVCAIGVRHDKEKIARTADTFSKDKPDLSMGQLFAFMKAADIAFTFDARLPSGDHISFAVSEPAELSLVFQKLVGERALSPVLRATQMSKTSIDSLIAHPEENRMSTVFRLLQHFDIKVGAQTREAVLKAEVELDANFAASRAPGNRT